MQGHVAPVAASPGSGLTGFGVGVSGVRVQMGSMVTVTVDKIGGCRVSGCMADGDETWG